MAILVYIVEHSIGLLPVLGLITVVLLKLVTGLGLLFIAATGIVRAISGQYWKIPILGEYDSRVPF